MSVCKVGTCKNQSTTIGSPISFHIFPKDKNLQQIWIEKCGRTEKFNPDIAHVCSIHFTAEDFQRDLRSELLGIPQRHYLKPGAVPTLNLRQNDTGEEINMETNTGQRRQFGKIKSAKIAEEICDPLEQPSILRIDRRDTPLETSKIFGNSQGHPSIKFIDINNEIPFCDGVPDFDDEQLEKLQSLRKRYDDLEKYFTKIINKLRYTKMINGESIDKLKKMSKDPKKCNMDLHQIRQSINWSKLPLSFPPILRVSRRTQILLPPKLAPLS